MPLPEVKNIRTTELKSDFARLEWDVARMPGLAYKIWLDGVARGTAVTEPRIDLAGLKPGQRYKVEIRTQPHSKSDLRAPSKKVTYYFTTPFVATPSPTPVRSGDGVVIIESPVGADIFVDGRKVGTVGKPVPETGKLEIVTVPSGARVYTKRLNDYVYGGLTPQTLTLPASPVPVLVKVTKPEFSDVHDLVYILPNETIKRRYAMERISIEEPEEATTTLKVMSHPSAEAFLYMEGAEGFISYGRTPQTLTLKARTGAWVPMQEAKRAVAETRLSPIENERVKTEDARRTAIVEAAQKAYDDAKAEREDVEETLSGFRESYNLFQGAFNMFFSEYTTFITDYRGLNTQLISTQVEISQLESMESLSEWERSYLNDLKVFLRGISAQIAQLTPIKEALDTEKVQWDADKLYWTDIIQDYESRRQQCRVYEQQMEDELIEVRLRARAPFWLPTPGMKGVMWHLKLEEKGYRTEVDEFLLEPGRPVTKDYAIVKIVDVTTAASLAPLIINTPRPIPPDSPFAFAWLFIITWPQKTNFLWGVTDVALDKKICASGSGGCGNKFIKVKPGRRTYLFSGHTSHMVPVTMTLDIAPGETRYVQLDIVHPDNKYQLAHGGAWLGGMNLKSWQPDCYKK